MLPDQREPRLDELFGIPPVMMKVQGRAMIDQVESLVPVEQVRILRGAIHVRDKRVEPHDLRSDPWVHGISSGGIEHGGAGKIVEREVQTDAGAKEVADFLIGLVSSKGIIDLDENKFRHTQTGGTSDFTGDQLSDQRKRTLSRTSELQDVQTEIIRFDDSRQ